MLHDEFLSVAKKLNNFLAKSLDSFSNTDDKGQSIGTLLAFNHFGSAFMSVAKHNGIVPDEKVARDLNDLAVTVKDLAETLDREQGMDDVDFRRDIQSTVNKLAANGIG
jgi:hypothetical protein|tara:strand:+ start:624 stop:950 length:327 start_codon:yes stop_codon:yes gene_type:complete